MEYVIGAVGAVLISVMGGWFFYNACIGPKKDRLSVAIVWGVGIAIIFALGAFGG